MEECDYTNDHELQIAAGDWPHVLRCRVKRSVLVATGTSSAQPGDNRFAIAVVKADALIPPGRCLDPDVRSKSAWVCGMDQ